MHAIIFNYIYESECFGENLGLRDITSQELGIKKNWNSCILIKMIFIIAKLYSKKIITYIMINVSYNKIFDGRL